MGRSPLVGVNLAFTHDGVDKLIPGAHLGDSSFAVGTKSQAVTTLGDPGDAHGAPATWDANFLAAAIDGVFLITGGTSDDVDGAWSDLSVVLSTSVTVVYDQMGNVRPGTEAGHEHVGWKDGVSQPAVSGLTPPLPGQQVIEPGNFVFGYPGPNPNVNTLSPPQPWMKNGSFMVFLPAAAAGAGTLGVHHRHGRQQAGPDPVLLGPGWSAVGRVALRSP